MQFADPKDEYRLVMAIRNDLKMQKGKVAAQCGHAAVAAYAKALKQRPELLKLWMRYGSNKMINTGISVKNNIWFRWYQDYSEN